MPYHIWRVVAAALAIALLAIQILAALEYTQHGSDYARASTIAALVSLAILPLLVIQSLKERKVLLALALLATCGAMLAYSLPATISRAGDAREALAAQATQSSKAQSRYDAAYRAMVAECATGEGSRCRGMRSVLRVTSIESDKRVTSGDLGSEILAWLFAAIGITQEMARRISIVSFALGSDIGICALVAFAGGCRRLPATADAYRAPPSPPEPPPTKKPKPKKKERGTIGERWMSNFVSENPGATVSSAYRAYHSDRTIGGRRMARKKFASLFVSLRPNNVVKLAA